MVNEQTGDKVIALEVQTAKMTAGVLRNAMRAYLNKNNNKHGKMKLKQLLRKDQTLKSIEITDKNIKSFEKIAKKYGVDFALKKDIKTDDTDEPTKYLVFFKAKDADIIEMAFKEFTQQILKDKDKDKANERPSVKENLKNSKEQVKKRAERQRERTHKREQSL